jgi:cystathionine beta-synthase
MMVHRSVLEMIGRTPMIEVTRLDTGPCRLFLKLESANPGGSIKDRMALEMIEGAERRGELAPGGTIVEATAGNTGIGLALVAAQKGYRLVLVIPDKMSAEKVHNCRALGAEVVLTRSDVAKGHPEYYQDLAKRLADENGWYFINQFFNPDNAAAHERTTAPEIWEQMDHELDAVVLGVGSSGTIGGLAAYFKRVAPAVELVLADPVGSILAQYVNDGTLSEKSGSWLVEGIGEDFIPPICDLSLTKVAYTIPDREAFATARELLRVEGINAGSSSGTLVAAALRYCRAQTAPKRVVSFACDTGTRYVSKMYNDFWLRDLGLVELPKHGDLRDLITRPHGERAVVTVGPDDTLATAHVRMRNGGYSQIPVMDGERLVGVLTELDIIRAVQDAPEVEFTTKVAAALGAGFPVVPVGAPVEALVERIGIDPTVAVVDGEGRFLGLITRSDVLNWMRRRA